MNAQLIEQTAAGEEEFELAAETFKLLADATRLKLLWVLLHGEHSVTDLAGRVGVRVPAVSQQLAKLRAARLVRVRRDGNRMYYAAGDAHVRALVEQALSHTGHLVRETREPPPTGRPARARAGARRPAGR